MTDAGIGHNFKKVPGLNSHLERMCEKNTVQDHHVLSYSFKYCVECRYVGGTYTLMTFCRLEITEGTECEKMSGFVLIKEVVINRSFRRNRFLDDSTKHTGHTDRG